MNVHAAQDELRAQGVTVVRGALSDVHLGALRGALAANRASGRPMSRQVLYTHRPTPPDRPPLTALMDQWLSPHRYDDAGSTRAVAQAIQPIADALLGAESVLFQDLILVKRQGQRAFPWHQDFGFWPVDRPLGVVIWAPLYDADGASGALQFAAGSHRLGPRPVVDLHTGEPQDPDAPLAFDPADWTRFAPTYASGDAVAFSPLTFHASPAMHRAGERPAWSCVFLSSRVRWSHANAPNHPLCKVVPDGALISEVPHE